MSEIVERNKNETDPNICHSHDFCDANMFLHEVFMAYGMDVADESGMERYGPCETRLGIWPSRGNFEPPIDPAPYPPRVRTRGEDMKLKMI